VSRRACVIGAGPNGLSAAIVLAQAGMRVDVFEAEPQPGGGARTLELTLPGYHHDFGSAVHPLAIGSPFFSSLSLEKRGLKWIHSPAALAHPLDDGTAVVLEQDLARAESSLGEDAGAWRRLMRPFSEHWSDLASAALRPLTVLPQHPLLMAKLGLKSFPSARTMSRRFRNERTRALLAGMAAHSFLSLEQPMSSAAAVLLGAALHAVGWPIPAGGAQSITNALCRCLTELGVNVSTSARIESLSVVPNYELTLCDVAPRQLVQLAGNRLSESFRQKLGRYRYGPGVFKVDYALRDPIPWTAAECRQAATVHLGGTFDEIAASEAEMRSGQHPQRPFVLLSQPTLFDSSRAPENRQIAWAYCHVPNGSTFDMLGRLEDQIERYAPGFRDCILKRRIFNSADLEAMDANLIGGDVSGGSLDFRQMLIRPTWRNYATSAKDIFICSSSTPPGGGVHGMCGYHAAKLALSKIG
jgi:phytoene dehydrogenase-like protein